MVTEIRDRIQGSDRSRQDAGTGEGCESYVVTPPAIRIGLGPWTTDRFVEVVYRELTQKK